MGHKYLKQIEEHLEFHLKNLKAQNYPYLGGLKECKEFATSLNKYYTLIDDCDSELYRQWENEVKTQ